MLWDMFYVLGMEHSFRESPQDTQCSNRAVNHGSSEGSSILLTLRLRLQERR